MRIAAAAALFATAIVGCDGDETTAAVPPPPCEPAPASTSDPFAQQRDPSSERIALAGAIAARFMSDNQPEQMSWDWGDGVFNLGLVDLHRVTADGAQRDFYKAWIDHHIALGYRHRLTVADTCPPALSALALYRDSCQLPYRTVVTDTLQFLYVDALRTDDGGINHLGSSDLFGVTLWLDSLFMFGNVLIRWGEQQGDAAALDEFHDQFLVFMSHLQDDSGWLKHAHNWTISQEEDVFWGRGNSWVAAAGYEYLGVRKDRGEQDPEVEAALAMQVQAIIAAQDPDTGLWWTVVNRPGDSYLETSASALFAVGLARGHRSGLLDDSVLPVIELAMQGVVSRISDDGGGPIVTGISGPTMVGDFDYYAGIETHDNIHYGVGAVILALLETSGL